jgi:GDPmannose 4,6-dehydratase
MQWMMLQQDEAKDYVIATGKQYSVREFITWSGLNNSQHTDFVL